MSEKLSPEVRPQLHIESFQDATERLKSELELLPHDASEEPDLIYMGQKIGEDWIWGNIRGGYEPEEAIVIDPSDPADRQVFEIASERARDNDAVIKHFAIQEGRWWVGSKAEEAVETSLIEAFRVSEGDKHLDVLNCSDQLLSDLERSSIQKVFNHVANYTGGKIFSRLSGIVLAGNKDGFKDHAAGDHQMFAGTIRLNMDVIREKSDLERYKRYFEGIETNWFEVVLAHEMGHAMDIMTFSEAEAHGLDTAHTYGFGGITNDHSAAEVFDRWIPTVKTDAKTGLTKTQWNYKMMMRGEAAATDYAKTTPGEDFAEAFAIASLGGDMSKLPERQKMLAKTIMNAEGDGAIGPKKVKFEKLQHEKDLLQKIDTATLKVIAK